MPTLSLCMIVKNEEQNLPRCLASAADITDQIVVVDTGSTDDTPNIAQRFGAEVYHFPWNNDFSAARNESLRHATGDWILILDADDELSPEAREAIPLLLTDCAVDAYGLVVRNLSPDNDLVRYVDDTRFRLFRNGKGFQYEYKVHNQIAPSILRQKGRTRDTNLVIIHHGYAENAVAKARRSLPLIQSALAADPQNVYMQFKLAETLKAVGENQASLEAFMVMLQMDYHQLPVAIIATAFLRMAQLELGFDRYQACLEYARESQKLQPDNPISRYLSGIALLYLGRVDEALQLFEQIDHDFSDDYFKKDDLRLMCAICRNLLHDLSSSVIEE